MGVDWQSLFVPQMSLLELFIRGTFIYLFLFVLLRILVRRHVGEMSLTDMLLIVLIADAAQNAMAGEYKTLTEGALLCTTVIGWSYFLDWLCFRVPALRHIIEPSPLQLIKEGRVNRKHTAKELLSDDELMSQLRQKGIESIDEVREASLEPDGQLSVFKRTEGKERQNA